MVEVVSGVGISVVGRGADNRGDAVVSCADFVVTCGGPGWRDYCRLDKISRELWEDLPYSLPFTFNVGDLIL